MTENKTETAPTVTEPTSEAPKPFQLIPPFSIGKKAKGMAKAAGVDLEGVEAMAPRINEWASSVEERLNIIISTIPNLPAQTIELLKAEAEKQRAEMVQRTPVQMPGVGSPVGGGDLMSLAAQFAPMLFGGGGSSGLSEEITKQVVDAGIKQMFAGTRLLEAIQTKIMTDMGVKAVTETIVK